MELGIARDNSSGRGSYEKLSRAAEPRQIISCRSPTPLPVALLRHTISLSFKKKQKTWGWEDNAGTDASRRNNYVTASRGRKIQNCTWLLVLCSLLLPSPFFSLSAGISLDLAALCALELNYFFRARPVADISLRSRRRVAERPGKEEFFHRICLAFSPSLFSCKKCGRPANPPLS